MSKAKSQIITYQLAAFPGVGLVWGLHHAYFGILHGMRCKEVKTRGRFLLDLLELPSKDKVIRKLR